MIKRKSGQPGFAGVISILLLYIVLIVLILIFAGRLLSDVSTDVSFSRLKYLALSLVLPLFLIVNIAVNIVKLIKQKRNKASGAAFKAKLLVFFTFISLLSSIPQGILSLTFINTAMDSWFSSGTGTALNHGLDLALEYNKLVSAEIKSFSKSRIFDNILSQIFKFPDKMWADITSIHPMIDSLEIYEFSGNRVMKFGDRSSPSSGVTKALPDGTVSRYRQGENTILKIRRDFVNGDEKYYAVLGTALPENFDAEAGSITRAIQKYTRFEHFYSKFFMVLILFFIYFSLPILLLSILTSFILSDEVIKPIVHLEEAINRVIDGDFSHRILSKQKDDLANLVNSFNIMVSELDQSRQNLVQSEKVSAWQEIAQRMAHEIKNPLTPIKLSAQRILKKYKEDRESFDRILEPSIDAIIGEVENLTKLIQQFRDFAKMPVPNLKKVNIKDQLQQIISLYSESFPDINIDISGVKDVSLTADPDLLRSMFSNLVSNAVESLEGRAGRITFQTSVITKGNLEYCRIQIHDTGQGMDELTGKKIFNPYFTTKDGGTGLGLPIVERIVAEHKGRIWFESEKGVGTTFFIDLPIKIRKKEQV